MDNHTIIQTEAMRVLGYNYAAIDIGENGEEAYSAKIPKFPGMLVFGGDLNELHDGVQCGIEFELEQLKKEGHPIPAPDKRSNSKFKGKIILRTTPQLHEKLFLEAQANQMSLNKYIESRLK